eukprot:7016628-Prymnesium_polylepis.1
MDMARGHAPRVLRRGRTCSSHSRCQSRSVRSREFRPRPRRGCEKLPAVLISGRASPASRLKRSEVSGSSD